MFMGQMGPCSPRTDSGGMEVKPTVFSLDLDPEKMPGGQRPEQAQASFAAGDRCPAASGVPRATLESLGLMGTMRS